MTLTNAIFWLLSGGSLGAIGALLLVREQKKKLSSETTKNDAEAMELLGKSYTGLITIQGKFVEDLRNLVAQKDARIAELERRVNALEQQLAV